MASTTMAFVVSGLLGHKKFAPEDIQNATLAGGVIVGATADMILQPYGAVTAGTIAGIVSCLGYKVSCDLCHSSLLIILYATQK